MAPRFTKVEKQVRAAMISAGQSYPTGHDIRMYSGYLVDGGIVGLGSSGGAVFFKPEMFDHFYEENRKPFLCYLYLNFEVESLNKEEAAIIIKGWQGY